MIFQTLVHRGGARASHLVGCRATRSAAVFDPQPDELSRYADLAAEQRLELKLLLYTSPTSPEVVGDTYRALLDELGLDAAGEERTVVRAAPISIVKPIRREGDVVVARLDERDFRLERPTGERARIAELAGDAWHPNARWNAATLRVGDLRVELVAAPGDGAGLAFSIADRTVVVGDVARFAEALAQHPEARLAFPRRGAVSFLGGAPGATWTGGAHAEWDDADAEVPSLGTSHPDGYRCAHPLEVLPWLDRMLAVEVAATGSDRHLPGAWAFDGDPAALAAALHQRSPREPILVASEFGYDCRPYARALVRAGFAEVVQLRGGIHRWSQNALLLKPLAPPLPRLAVAGSSIAP